MVNVQSNQLKDRIMVYQYNLQHFASIGKKLSSTLPQSCKDFRDYLSASKHDFNSFYFNPISPSQVQCQIDLIPGKKARSIYSFPQRILKDAKHILSDH
jgi:hypothetical protein